MEEELPDLTVYEIGAKAKSKQKVYRILSTEERSICGLEGNETTTLWETLGDKNVR